MPEVGWRRCSRRAPGDKCIRATRRETRWPSLATRRRLLVVSAPSRAEPCRRANARVRKTDVRCGHHVRGEDGDARPVRARRDASRRGV